MCGVNFLPGELGVISGLLFHRFKRQIRRHGALIKPRKAGDRSRTPRPESPNSLARAPRGSRQRPRPAPPPRPVHPGLVSSTVGKTPAPPPFTPRTPHPHPTPRAPPTPTPAGAADGAGRLDAAAFAEGLSRAAGPHLRTLGRGDRQRAAACADQLFEAFCEADAEEEAPYVRVPELVAGLSGVSAGGDEERVAAAFALYDQDGDGRIDLAEMTGYLTAVFKFVYGAGNGPMCGSMVGASPEVLAAKVAKRLIQVMDTDHDGTVSFAEFYRWYAGHGLGGPLAADRWRELLVFEVPRWLSLDEARRLTGLAGQSVRDVFQRFAAHADPRGELGKEAFTAALSHLGAAHDLAEHDAAKFHYLADRLFDAFDADHNGAVSFGELTAGLSFLCADGTTDADSRMRTVWEFLDDDGDGHVSPEEMRKYMVAVFRVLFETHQGLRDKLGVTAEEIGVATADNAFEEADTNHDGHISFEEFARWYSSGAGAFLQQTMREALSVEEIRRLTGLGDVPITRAVRAFAARATPEGELTRAGFFASCASFLDPLAPGAGDRRKKLQTVLNALYDLFDKDGNGRVDLAEVAAGLSVICAGRPDDKVAEIFALFDVDGDGFITFGEMKQYLQSVFAVMYAAYPEQLCGVPAEQLAAATTAQAFAEADTNHDGVISLEEFTAWYRQGQPDVGGSRASDGDDHEEGEDKKEDKEEEASTAGFTTLFPPTPEMVETRRLLRLDCFNVEDLLETFAEVSDKGRLGFAEYLRQFGHLRTLGGGAGAGAQPGDTAQFLVAAERLFRAFENEAGTVNLASLVTALTVLCGAPFEQKLAAAFTLYDLDGDGAVSFTELVKFVACVFIALEACSAELGRLFSDAVELAIRVALECYRQCGLERGDQITAEQFRAFVVQQ